MVSRTAFTQLGYRWDLLVLTLLTLAVVVASPPLVLGLGGLEMMLAGATPSATVIRAVLWAGLSWVLMTVALWPAVRYHHVPVIYAATLPFGGALFGLMTATSAWRHLMGRGPSWRGRTYDAS